MACNIATQRRRKKWQNFQPENSPCHCDTGFAAAGCVAREWWVRWDEAQLDAKWLWLNAGFILTFNKIDSGRCIYSVNPSVNEAIDFSFIGSNVEFDDPVDGTITVDAQLLIRVDTVFPLPVGTFVDQATTGLLWPEPTATFSFSLFTTIIPVPGLPSTIVGEAFVTPLKPCHDCT